MQSLSGEEDEEEILNMLMSFFPVFTQFLPIPSALFPANDRTIWSTNQPAVK